MSQSNWRMLRLDQASETAARSPAQVTWWAVLVTALASSLPISSAKAQCGPLEVLKLESPSAQPVDGFAGRVAVRGAYMAVVDAFDSQVIPGGGAIFVYERRSADPASWVRVDDLRIPGLPPTYLNNSSLDIDGNTLVVGVADDETLGIGAGAVYVFERSHGELARWRLTAQLLASDSRHDDAFGFDVSLSGDEICIGAPRLGRGSDIVGAVYCFERDRSAVVGWVQRQKIMPDNLVAGDQFGASIDHDATRLVVGAKGRDVMAPNDGAVFTFEKFEGGWIQEDILVAVDGQPSDEFGTRVVLDEYSLIVGAPLNGAAATDAGAVYVFRRVSASWALEAKLLAVGGSEGEFIGGQIAAENDTIVVGSPFADDLGWGTGAVYVFEREAGTGGWIQSARLVASDAEPLDFFGIVAMDRGVIAIGALKPQEPGTVYLFAGRDAPTAATYCSGTAGSLADCAPELHTLGSPTVWGDTTFRIWSRNLPGAHFGLFLYTTAPWALPDLAASGICLPGGGVRRSGILWSGGTAGACDGVLDVDWNTFGGALAQDDPALAVPGTTVHGQFVWFEPFGSSALTWSDAVAFQLCP